MGNKNLFDVAQKSGIQYFQHDKENMRVLYFGSSMQSCVNGEVVFVQRKDGKYWFGRTYHNMYVFIFHTPIDRVLDGLAYLFQEREMLEAAEEDPFGEQGELPF